MRACGRVRLESDGSVREMDERARALLGGAWRPDPRVLDRLRGGCLACDEDGLTFLYADAEDGATVFVLSEDRGRGAPVNVESLAHAVSHDVRAPLRAVEAFATFLAEDAGSLPAAATADLERLRGATKRLRSHLDALVDFLRAPQDRGAAGSALVGARDAAAAFKARFALRGGSVRVEGDDVRVAASEEWLGKVLARLLDNVLAHHPGAPAARILVENDPRGARISVSDDGPGVSAEDLRKLGELFRRAGPRAPSDERAGAGLAIVRRAVEANGGSFSLGKADEGGLLVQLVLPRKEARAAA